MSKDRFITPVFAGGTRDTVVGTSINGYAIGIWADETDQKLSALSQCCANLTEAVKRCEATNRDLVNHVIELEAQVQRMKEKNSGSEE